MFNPFLSPSFNDIEELNSWKSSNIRTGVITDTEPLTSHWIHLLGRPEKKLQETHIDAALGLLWLRRNKDPIYFHNKRLPKSTFVRPDFFSNLIAGYFSFKEDNFKSQHVFPKEVTDIVSGKLPSVCHPTEKWQDLEGVYGIAYNSKYKQYIGMEISFKSRKITVFDCRTHESKGDLVETHVKPIAEMIPYLLRTERNRGTVDLSPFKVLCPKKFFRRIKSEANCGLFILKMVECHSMGVEEMMSKLQEEVSEDIRAKLCFDIYHDIILKKIEMFRG
ncbi:PREDICTED: uncharacterized protein LOC104710982 [Camelina sativa]|uniref:Uncharacterized protein LOC104710982 n=1 Tax=Camelina sativa TaxID=90675 RepID=A0ABM0TG76_CAMSA|nr:PREDICTED: uncharacterized protein LOC104710982 [Camelina sativa]